MKKLIPYRLFEALQISTDEAFSMVNIDLLKRLSDHFVDIEDTYAQSKTYNIDEPSRGKADYTMGKVAYDSWFCTKDGLLKGNICSISSSYKGYDVEKWHYTHTDTGPVLAYRVFIELNSRYESIPDDILADIKGRVSRTEDMENLKFFRLLIKNYNWNKYKSEYLATDNIDNFNKYDGDVVSFSLLFTEK